MQRIFRFAVLFSLAAAPGPAQDPAAAKAALIARAKSLELATPYVPPPGDPLSHHAAGYAKIMCSAVFITGLDPDFAAANVGFFVAPLEERPKLGKPVVDRTAREVRITLKNGVTRIARYLGDQGCLTLPEGETTLHYTPKPMKKGRPPPRRRGRWATPSRTARQDSMRPRSRRPWTRPSSPPSPSPRPSSSRGRAGSWPSATARASRPRRPSRAGPWARASSRRSSAAHPAGRLPARAESAHPGVAGPGRPAERHPHRRHPAHVERPADPRSGRPRLRSPGPLPRPRLPLHGRRRFLPLRGDAPTAVAAQHGRTLPQHRPRPRELPRAPRRHETRRGLPLLPAARPLRQARHPHHGPGDGPVRELPDPGLRARLGPRLGPPRQPLPAGRRLERRAPAPRRLREVREHGRPRLASRPPPDLRRLLLDQRRPASSPSPARPTSCPAPAARRR